MFGAPTRLSPPPKDVPCFPALRIFECESMEAAPNLLEQTGRCLVEFSLLARSWTSSPTKRNFQELYAALASSCTHTLLEKITVQEPRDAESINPAQLDLHVVSGDDLKRLFCFRNLVHVWLAHTIAVDMDDTLALEMARAWPRIELLAFPCEPTHRITPRLTLEGVYAFAEHCHLLEHLCTLFDATTVPNSKLTLSGQCRASQDTLTYLDVAYSPIGTKKKEWRRVAEFLRSIFPKLDSVEAAEVDSTADARALAMCKAWTKVSVQFP